MEQNEIDLIRRAQAGSVEAFDELIKRHDDGILRLIQSTTGSFHDACDIFQDTFIRAFNNIRSYRFESDFKYWLGRIAINLAMNWHRKYKKKRFLSLTSLVNEPEDLSRNTVNINTDSEIMQSELCIEIQNSINQLKGQQRIVFILKHQCGYKISEISEFLNSAEGTVKNHLFRATNKMRKMLQPYYDASV